MAVKVSPSESKSDIPRQILRRKMTETEGMDKTSKDIDFNHKRSYPRKLEHL